MLPSFVLFGKTIGTYAVMAGIGALVSLFFACRWSEAKGIRNADMIEVLLVGALGVVFGSHLLYALVEIPYWSQMTLLEIISGSVFYGGLIGGLVSGYFWVKAKRYPMAAVADAAGCCIPLFHGFARIGCFLGGCCYGVESAWGWIMTNSPAPGANGVRRFPVQLLEAACELLIFFVILLLMKKEGREEGKEGRKTERKQGSLLNLYLILYAVVRFLLEFLRGDSYRGFYGVFSTSQWISLLILAVHLVYYMTIGLRKRNAGNRKGEMV